MERWAMSERAIKKCVFRFFQRKFAEYSPKIRFVHPPGGEQSEFFNFIRTGLLNRLLEAVLMKKLVAFLKKLSIMIVV